MNEFPKSYFPESYHLSSILSLIILITGLMISQTFEGISGKISGRIIDKTTGDPLTGCNEVKQDPSKANSLYNARMARMYIKETTDL